METAANGFQISFKDVGEYYSPYGGVEAKFGRMASTESGCVFAPSQHSIGPITLNMGDV